MILPHSNTPSLNGLVLTGGKSTRMGSNKDVIKWDKEHRYYIADMLGKFCEDIFISCRQDQEKELNSAYKALPDSFLDMGPMSGILSDFRSQAEKAWLMIPCDLPLVNEETL